MAVDKLVDSSQLDSDLTSVANAIRAKSGGSGQLAFPAGFVSEIGNIPSGGGGLALIGSGSYTYSGSATSAIDIPVTYTGTPKALFILKDELDTGVGETFSGLHVMATGVQIIDNVFPEGSCVYKIKAANESINIVGVRPNDYFFLANAQHVYQEDGLYLRFSKYGNANLIQPGTYSWYIYG